MDATCGRIARAMGCEPDSGDDLVEAVRLLVQERDAERAKVARLVALLKDARRGLKDAEREMDEEYEGMDIIDAALAEVAPVVAPVDDGKNHMIYAGGSKLSFHCPGDEEGRSCGCNVFRRLDETPRYKCNACGSVFRAEVVP